MNPDQRTEDSAGAFGGNLPGAVPMRQLDKPHHPYSIEETNKGYSNRFPDDLPDRPAPAPAVAPWKQRVRAFFTFSLSSYSIIHTPDGAARVRHIAMFTILLLRSGMSALSILSAVIKGSIAGIIVYSLLAVLGLWFTATCLAIIGDAQGDKHIKSIVVV